MTIEQHYESKMHLKLKMRNAVITGYDGYGKQVSMNTQVPIKSIGNAWRSVFNRIFGKRFRKITSIIVRPENA